MARSLRPRKPRPSYASLVESDNEGPIDEDADTSDEFQPVAEQEDPKDLEIGDASDVESPQDGDIMLEQSESVTVKTPRKRKKLQKGKTKQESAPSSSLPRPTAGLSRSATRPGNAPSISAFDHRQRAEPVYLRSARVERLAKPPRPFKPSVTTPTPCWNSTKSSADRYIKASGYNIGRGPVWELLEDRSWWKESHIVEVGATETEATRRPRVYESIRISTGLQVIDEQEASKYLPAGNETPDEHAGERITCHFGTPDNSVTKELKMFDSFEMFDDVFDTGSHVFYAGGPVWSLDWCPMYAEDHPHRSYTQYIAIAPLPSKSYSPRIGRKCSTPSPACIQIWSYSPKSHSQGSSAKGMEKVAEADRDHGKMTCELVLCIENGQAHELKWCPLPSHDSWAESQSGDVRKLGLLAGTFEDGSLSIFAVPDPENLRPMDKDRAIFIRIQPVVRIELEETCIWSLDWADTERIAVGCTNGSIAVYKINGEVLNGSVQEILPSHYFSVHQSAIRSVRWIPIPPTTADGMLDFSKSPNMIASGGYDGCVAITDIRDGYGSILNRTRDVILTVTYSHFTEGTVTIDLDNNVKTYTMAPGILGRGNVVMEAGGPIWSLHTSDYHPFLAVGSADGSLLITNMLRFTRRTGAAPFLFFKVFQMDYNRKSGEYRMLDHFLPEEIPDRSSYGVAKKGTRKASETENLSTGVQGTGVWPAEVSVTRVSWNNGAGLARAPLLASATSSGLCRIDWLLGQFQDNRVPYGGIEYIRNELSGDVKMDEDDAE